MNVDNLKFMNAFLDKLMIIKLSYDKIMTI